MGENNRIRLDLNLNLNLNHWKCANLLCVGWLIVLTIESSKIVRRNVLNCPLITGAINSSRPKGLCSWLSTLFSGRLSSISYDRSPKIPIIPGCEFWLNVCSLSVCLHICLHRLGAFRWLTRRWGNYIDTFQSSCRAVSHCRTQNALRNNRIRPKAYEHILFFHEGWSTSHSISNDERVAIFGSKSDDKPMNAGTVGTVAREESNFAFCDSNVFFLFPQNFVLHLVFTRSTYGRRAQTSNSCVYVVAWRYLSGRKFAQVLGAWE